MSFIGCSLGGAKLTFRERTMDCFNVGSIVMSYEALDRHQGMLAFLRGLTDEQRQWIARLQEMYHDKRMDETIDKPYPLSHEFGDAIQ